MSVRRTMQNLDLTCYTESA